MDEAKATILIVDDEETIRDIVSRRLQAEGYNCVTAADGNEALWQSFMHDFELVLTDIKMPGISGMEVLSQIANDHPDTGVVMITALAETKTAVEAMKLGAYDYVTKPFNLDDLVMRVARALERRRLVLENREYQLNLEQKVERQVGQIRQYYRDAIEALAREEMVLGELKALRGKEHANDTASAGTPTDSHELSSPIKGLARKLSQLIGSGTTDSPPETSDAAIEETETPIEESQRQLSLDHKERKEESLALYDGTAELAIVPPVSLHQMLQLHERLRTIPRIQVSNLGGSVDKGITIRLILESPTPLIEILTDLPEVESASDESQETEQIVPGRKGEDPPVRRIVLELVKKSAAETPSQTPDEV